MAFGGSTIVFTRLVKVGEPDDLGNYELQSVDTEAPGCRHRPLTFTEIVEMQMDMSTQPWRSTLPLFEYDDALLDALDTIQHNDFVTVDGEKYQIVGGVRPFPDRNGNPFKATMISQKQHG